MKHNHKEGDTISDRNCPKCDKQLVYESGFIDCFSYRTGHYTIDRPLAVCPDPKCEYFEDYEEQ